MSGLTGGSLFSGGIDGLAIAASLAGFDIRFHVEYDDWRRKVLEKHARLWPNSIQHKDVTQVSKNELPQVDVLFGGFPCQDVSLAGNRRGLAEGTRSGLWFHFRRLIGDLRPRAVVIENTAGLLSLGGTQVVEDLRGLGYVGRVGVISAADVGAPHLRERVFIVAYAGQNRQPRAQPQPGQGADSENRVNPLYQLEHDRIGQHITNQAIAGGAVYRGSERPYTSNQRLRNQPRVGRNTDGITARLDGFTGFPAYQNKPQHPDEPPRIIPRGPVGDRVKRREAMGDAIVWQVAYPIFYYLRQALEGSCL